MRSRQRIHAVNGDSSKLRRNSTTATCASRGANSQDRPDRADPSRCSTVLIQELNDALIRTYRPARYQPNGLRQRTRRRHWLLPTELTLLHRSVRLHQAPLLRADMNTISATIATTRAVHARQALRPLAATSRTRHPALAPCGRYRLSHAWGTFQFALISTIAEG
jgi:hypothetical protein